MTLSHGSNTEVAKVTANDGTMMREEKTGKGLKYVAASLNRIIGA